MHLTRLRWATAFALVVVVTGAGVVHLVPAALAAADDTAKSKAELKKLQGTWVAVSIEEGGTKKDATGDEHLSFDGETFAMMDGEAVRGKGPVKLDPSKDPMEMDLEFKEGKNEGTTGRGIYAWDDGNLKICAVKDEGLKRPTEFSTSPDDKRILIVLKRQKP